ncbi:M20 family metallopeptidase [Fervidibacillus halotolerans]|uniref:Peptidase M20 domain-containing protein 2 n=1 Tax=Fervidibacillus halotolerans TaxID=2980027 RepID=A0A9E8LZN1_9BACI|nr:M20 family metallopeptidase [Fervidibacillus halotolerans]WAA12758.1 M20 family metallopeptidase [Fervidibacillus halotolerans]
MKDKIRFYLENIMGELFGLCKYMYKHPELGDREFESSKRLANFLRENGFSIEWGIVGRDTAFRAEFSGSKRGPTICFLAEYDALPGVGHGCGHNLIGTISTGAGIILSKFLSEIGGKVVVLGTPAEETNGAKVPMAEQGIFDDIDVAMMVHPSDESYMSGDSLAMDALQFTFFGKSAHAAAAPEKGINALDSVILLFNGINALREHLPADVKIHGIINEGGRAANIVPDLASAQFYIRASTRAVLNPVVEKVKNIARGSALMTGARLEISNYELSYDNMVTNQHLSKVFTKHLSEISSKPIHPPKQEYGSLDMGNVSQVVPAIHPYIGLNHPGLVAHTKEFADRTVTEHGRQALMEGALALAYTGYDCLTDSKLMRAIQEEFLTNKNRWENNCL